MRCVGDLDDVCLGCANGASPADDISRFMAVTLRMSNGYVSGQFASTDLNSAEQFYLGGPYGVRAYPVAQSGGSQGALATLELRHQIQEKLMASAFFDAGTVQQYKNPNTYNTLKGGTNANNTYSLMGAGLGVRWEYEGWNINASVAWKVGQNPLYASYYGAFRPVNTDGTSTQPRGWISGSYNF